jgi:hypothetical protein
MQPAGFRSSDFLAKLQHANQSTIQPSSLHSGSPDMQNRPTSIANAGFETKTPFLNRRKDVDALALNVMSDSSTQANPRRNSTTSMSSDALVSDKDHIDAQRPLPYRSTLLDHSSQTVTTPPFLAYGVGRKRKKSTDDIGKKLSSSFNVGAEDMISRKATGSPVAVDSGHPTLGIPQNTAAGRQRSRSEAPAVAQSIGNLSDRSSRSGVPVSGGKETVSYVG